MADLRVKWNYPGMGKILRSAEMRADLERRARAIAAEAGGDPDYVADSSIGRTRARASVRTATVAAAREEATDHTLLRALDAGRL
jgi:hypothetical protein